LIVKPSVQAIVNGLSINQQNEEDSHLGWKNHQAAKKSQKRANFKAKENGCRYDTSDNDLDSSSSVNDDYSITSQFLLILQKVAIYLYKGVWGVVTFTASCNLPFHIGLFETVLALDTLQTTDIIVAKCYIMMKMTQENKTYVIQ
jgi:hypothetical protein